MMQWGESVMICQACDSRPCSIGRDLCSICEKAVADGLEAVEGYLGKQAAFSEYLAATERAAPKDGS